MILILVIKNKIENNIMGTNGTIINNEKLWTQVMVENCRGTILVSEIILQYCLQYCMPGTNLCGRYLPDAQYSLLREHLFFHKLFFQWTPRFFCSLVKVIISFLGFLSPPFFHGKIFSVYQTLLSNFLLVYCYLNVIMTGGMIIEFLYR